MLMYTAYTALFRAPAPCQQTKILIFRGALGTVETAGAEAVIPPRKNRNEPREYDRELYKERNLVERLFQKLKHFRRIATRYERLKRNYQSLLFLVNSVIWLA